MALEDLHQPQGMAQVDVFKLLGDQEAANTVHAHHYNEALVVLSKLGDVNSCIRILNSMLSRDMKVHRTTMNSVIAACAKAGDGPAAERWWRQMLQMGQGPNRVTYASVIHAWAKGGDMLRAEEWLLAMKEAGFSPAKGFCRPIAHILLQAKERGEGEEEHLVPLEAGGVEVKRADHATKWLLHFCNLGVLLDRSTINLLMSVYARNAEADKVEQWVYHMIQAGISPNQSTFHALILAHVKAGNADQARTWLSQMLKMGFDQVPVLEVMEEFSRGSTSGILRSPTGNGDQQPQPQQQQSAARQGLPMQDIVQSSPSMMQYIPEMDEPGVDSSSGGNAPLPPPWPEDPASSALSNRGDPSVALPGRGGAQISQPDRGADRGLQGAPPDRIEQDDQYGVRSWNGNGTALADTRPTQCHFDPRQPAPRVDPLLEAIVAQGLSASIALSRPTKKGTRNAMSWKGKGPGDGKAGRGKGRGFEGGKAKGRGKGGGDRDKSDVIFEPRDMGNTVQQEFRPMAHAGYVSPLGGNGNGNYRGEVPQSSPGYIDMVHPGPGTMGKGPMMAGVNGHTMELEQRSRRNRGPLMESPQGTSPLGVKGLTPQGVAPGYGAHLPPGGRMNAVDPRLDSLATQNMVRRPYRGDDCSIPVPRELLDSRLRDSHSAWMAPQAQFWDWN